MSLNKPKVLEIVKEEVSKDFFSGGMGVHCLQVFKRLSNEFDITVFCLSHTQKLVRMEENGYKIIKIGTENNYTNTWNDPMFNEMINLNVLIKNWALYLKDEKFDIVHLHDTHWWDLADFLRAYYKIPIVLTIHLNLMLSHPIERHPYYNYQVHREFNAYTYSDRIMTCSDNYKALIEKVYFPQHPIRAVHNGVDLEEINSIDYSKLSRKDFINGKDKLVVFVGRMVWSKGVDVILNVARLLFNYQFILISNVSSTMEKITPLLNKVIRHQEVYGNITWINGCFDEKKWQIMNCADVGIMPSLHEPFGIVALEWMAMKKPLIVSGIDGLNDFCKDGYNARVINPTTEELYNALRYFNYNQKMIKNGYKTAKKHNWQKVADVTKEVYNEVLK